MLVQSIPFFSTVDSYCWIEGIFSVVPLEEKTLAERLYNFYNGIPSQTGLNYGTIVYKPDYNKEWFSN